jgi:uroporphyrinogen-III synthase
MPGEPTVAVFRPDDERLAAAVDVLEGLDVDPLVDPMLEIDPTGRRPREDAAYTVLTSKTGAELLADTDWQPGGELCAIGSTTAEALREQGYSVDIVPETYSSAGLVECFPDSVDGARVEVARSDHGSAVLLDGLEAAGAYCHETVLYRLTRPESAGVSVDRAIEGGLDGALFSSSLTVEHFLDVATERGEREAALAGLDEAVVGTIGEPTADTARTAGVTVDVVPESAAFDALARETVSRIREQRAD